MSIARRSHAVGRPIKAIALAHAGDVGLEHTSKAGEEGDPIGVAPRDARSRILRGAQIGGSGPRSTRTAITIRFREGAER
jgi:hypothetical protein